MRVIIFGGTGFIGTHFASFLMENNLADEVVLADIKGLNGRYVSETFANRLKFEKISILNVDVRKEILAQMPPELNLDFDMIANFAAIHREPGHQNHEYYETNLLGAENVCAWAEEVFCKRIIFTSSIAPYGPTEIEKDERSIPVPVSAYGGSKLAAEKIHIAWQHTEKEDRNLVIVRPGVVFGPGEGGNVSRLIKSVVKKYFFYAGNQNTRKAGVYVKELCAAMYWVLDSQSEHKEKISLFNMTMNPGPSIKEYVDAVFEVKSKKNYIPSVPYYLLLGVAYIISILLKPLGVAHPFSPVRIRKLVHSNNVIPGYLLDKKYIYRYTLKEAFKDWYKDYPEEWK